MFYKMTAYTRSSHCRGKGVTDLSSSHCQSFNGCGDVCKKNVKKKVIDFLIPLTNSPKVLHEVFWRHAKMEPLERLIAKKD